MFFKLSQFYFWYFAVLGTTIPFWTRFLTSLEFSTSQVGILLGSMMTTRIFMPYVWGALSDRMTQRIWVIRLASILSFICFCSLFYIPLHFGYYLAFFILFSCCWNGILSQFEVLALRYAEQTHVQYGHVRLWGSVGFILSVIISGALLERFGNQSFTPIVATLMGIMLVSSGLSFQINEPPEPTQKPASVSIIHLIKNPVIISILLANLLLQASFGTFNGFYDLYLTEHGYSATLIGAMIGLGVFAEVVLFIYNGKLIARFGAKNILLFSLLLGVVRWVLTAFFPESRLLMIVVQLFHAFHFGAAHAVSIYLIHRLFPKRFHGRAQALYSSVCFGIGIAIGQIMSGYLWQFEDGGLLSFLISAIFCLIAAVVIARGVKKSMIP